MKNSKNGIRHYSVIYLLVLYFFIVVLLNVTNSCVSDYNTRNSQQTLCDSLLNELDRELVRKQNEPDGRFEKIQRIKSSNTRDMSDAEHYAYYDSLYNAYYAYQFDSAYSYLERKIDIAMQLPDKNLLQRGLLQRSRMNVGIGQYDLALDILKKINASTLDSANRIFQYEAYAYLYNNMKYNSRDNRYIGYYDEMYKLYADSLLALLPEDSQLAQEFSENLARSRGDMYKALEINTRRWQSVDHNSAAAASIAFDRAITYEHSDTASMLEWVARSAIADLRSDIKDNAAMAVLARLLYAGGDIDRAVRYISKSMDDALFYNTPYRQTQMARMQYLIDGAHAQQLAKANRNKFIMVCVSAVLLLAAVLLSFIMLKQIKKVKSLNNILSDEKRLIGQLKEKVEEADKIKEQSIKIFLEMSAKSTDMLLQFTRSIDAKLTQKKYAEIHQMIRSFNDSDLSTDERNRIFDQTFMKMFPLFLNHFNILLKPDERIELKKNGSMPPELRIFALIRLGIDSSADIAHLLRYSLSTIYNYRMKIRHKAIDKESDFDMAVKQIKGY